MSAAESPTVNETFPGAARLADLVAHVRDAETVLGSWRQQLRATVVNLIDVQGVPRGVVARAIGVSRTRIHAIIAGHYAAAT